MEVDWYHNVHVIDWTMSEGSSVLYILQCQDKDEREKGYHSPAFIGHSVITRISDTNMVWKNSFLFCWKLYMYRSKFNKSLLPCIATTGIRICCFSQFCNYKVHVFANLFHSISNLQKADLQCASFINTLASIHQKYDVKNIFFI